MWANPLGPQVVNGNVSFQNPDAATLNITNSPGAIIRWQDFSIAPGEVTNFIQQSASSAVLNRVVGGNISQIFGNLISNGQVYLINPSGILIGKGAVVDTAGFVASTLNMRKDDFQSGNLGFRGRKGAGDVVNEGLIRTTPGGMVLLLAPDITNSGVIETPEGEILLAAGRKITITSLDAEGVQFEIQSPANTVTNIGKLVADGGAVGVFAGTLNNSGVIQANALTRDEAGRIVLSARNSLEISNTGSVAANGPIGGDITLQSGKELRVEGNVSAIGDDGAGGNIRILGKQVALAGAAQVDASGQTGGGSILVGGDYQGANAAVPNAQTTYVGPDVDILADARDTGNGGRVIVWSDQLTRYFGNLSARGGPNGGNGGFAEISGKQQLVMSGGADLGAPAGSLGTLLLDPLDLFVDDGDCDGDCGGQLASLTDELTDVPLNVVSVSPDTLAAINGNVILQASRDLYFLSDVALTTTGQGLTAQAGDDLFVNASISTNNGALALTAGDGFSFVVGGSHTLSTTGGAISLTATSGQVNLPNVSLDAGSGAVNVVAPTGIFTSNVTGGVVNLTSTSGTVDTDNINSSGNLSLSGTNVQAMAINTNGGTLNATASNGRFIASGTIDTRPDQTGSSGGAVTVTATDGSVFSGNGNVSTQAINAGDANVSLSGERVNTNGSAIDTTGNVTLTAVNNDSSSTASINAKVDNAASVVATATRANAGQNNAASVTLTSDTTLNATTVTATNADCTFNGFCGGANITLSGTQGVNVGTVTATAPVNFNNTYNYGSSYADSRYENINETVNISSAAGSILAMSGTSQVSAADVTLSTIPSGNVPTGGAIGSTATPLRVDAERNFVFKAGGDFDIDVMGAGPSRLDIQLGVAPIEDSWFGILSGGTSNGVTLIASGDDAGVTVGSFTLTGFDQRVFNQNPSISLTTPNGNLDVIAASVPKGDNTGSYSPATRYTSGFYFPADTCVNGTASCTYRNSPSGLTTSTVTPGYESLPVTLRASGDLIVDSYTRGGTAGDLAKSVTFQSNDGSVTLGLINGNKDAVTIQADTGVSLTNDLTTGGNVAITNSISGDILIGNDIGDILTSNGNVTISNSSSGTGNVSIWKIDTSGGLGNVTVTASGATSVVGAASDNAGLEIDSAGTVTITAKTIGSNAFTNPLDLEANIVNLTASDGNIGSATNPVVARSESLVIDASNWWNVSTDSVAIKNLTISASPDALYIDGLGPFGDVTSQGTTYTLSSSGTGLLELDDDFSLPASTHFVNGSLAITAKDGGIELNNGLDYAVNFTTGGNISFYALNGITFWEDIDIGAGSLVLRSDGAVNMYNVSAGSVDASNRSSSGCLLFGFYGCGVASFTADDMALGATGSLTVAARGTIDIDDINGGAITLTSHDGDLDIGNIGATTAATSVNLRTGGYYFDNTGTGSIATGSIDASGSVQIRSTGTGILDGLSIITGHIGMNTAPTSVDIRARYSPAATQVGNIQTDDLTIISDSAAISTMAVDAEDVYLNAGGGVLVVAGEIGATRPAATVELRGNGIVGDDGVPLTAVQATGGTNNSGTVIIVDSGSNTFEFEEIDAGPDGTVSITSPNGILQTSSVGGITAQNVTLSAADTANGNISQAINGDSDLDLFGVKNLTVVVGDSADLDANGSTLESLSITMHSDCPDCSQFDLVNLGGSQTLDVFDGGGGDFHIELNSPSLLDFSFNATATGIQTSGGGIITSGGNVTLNSAGVFDGTDGGITTSGGRVTISAAGAVDTGAIATAGGNIAVTTNAGNGDIIVDGNLTAGNGTISLAAQGADSYIERSGGSVISSSASVSLTAADGSIGTSGTPMLITAPTVTLDARDPFDDGSQGQAFATLTGTNALTLRGDNSFDVSSTTAFSTLSVSTLGSRTGTLALTAPGQGYTFTRPATDLFGAGITDTLEVGPVTGTPLTSATFRAVDGDLLLRGGTTINATTLNLMTTVGEIKLQGNTANPLSLSNTTQNFTAGQDIAVEGEATFTAPTQNLVAARDINLLAGASAGESILFAATTQNFTSGSLFGLDGDINLNANTGSVTLQGVSQNLYAYGDINLTGGSAANAGVTVNATGSQLFSAGNYYYGPGNIVMQAGTGSAANILVQHSGSGNQTLRADGNITMTAGASANTSTILVDNQAGTQDLDAQGAIVLKGGAGTAATARIVNSGSGNQLIGNTFGYYYDGRLYTADSITVEGGSGSGAFAAVESTATGGSLQVFESSGLLKFQGGTGTNATATATTPGSQQLGWSYYYNVGDALGGLSLIGGSGTGAYASVTTPVAQQLWSYGDITLQGGAQDAYAALTANTQSINYGDVALTGGYGDDAYALIQATTSQSFSSGDLDLTGGIGADAYAKVQAGTMQTFNIDDMTLTGGVADIESGSPTGSFARVLALGGSQYFSMDDLQATGGDATGTDATVQAATSQTFFADDVTLTGGSGTNAFVRVLAGSSQYFSMDNLGITGGSAAGTDATVQAVTSQDFNGDDITLTGGTDASAVALFKGAGQTFDADDIMVESKTAAARIQDTSTGVQDFEADSVFVKSGGTAVAEITTGGSQVFDVGGGFTIETLGSGDARVVSPSTQTVEAAYVKVISSAAGNAALDATGDQTILTSNGLAAVDNTSMRVAALGTGTASVTSGGNQVIELDYPDLMYTNRDGTLKIGDPEAQGVSTVSAAGDQTIIAREIFIEGGGPTEVGTGTGASSKLNADGAQVISTLLGGISIAGGGGSGASASLDPTSQSIVTNGPLLLTGGSGSNATSSIFSSGPLFIAATFGDIVLTGGTGAGASASITTSFSSMSILTPGLVDFIAGSGSDSDAFMSAANGFGLVNIFCGAGCSYQTLFGNPVGNGNNDAGVVGVPGSIFDITEFLGSGYWLDWYFADNNLDQEDEPGLALICR